MPYRPRGLSKESVPSLDMLCDVKRSEGRFSLEQYLRWPTFYESALLQDGNAVEVPYVFETMEHRDDGVVSELCLDDSLYSGLGVFIETGHDNQQSPALRHSVDPVLETLRGRNHRELCDLPACGFVQDQNLTWHKQSPCERQQLLLALGPLGCR